MFKDRAVKIIRSIKVGRVSKIIFLLIFCLSIFGIFGQTRADTISDKQAEIDSLQQQINNYSAIITQKQKESSSLQNQIAAIDASLERTKSVIKQTEDKIDKNQMEIDDTQEKITQKQKEMDEKKNILKECIRVTYEQNKLSTLEILISSDSLSDFMDQMEYVSVVEDKTKGIYDEVKSIKDQLTKYRKDLENKRQELVKLKSEKETEQKTLEGQIATRQSLLTQTMGEEKTYQDKLVAAQAEQSAMNSEISSLQQDLVRNYLPGRGGPSSGYIWPLYGPITAPFGYSPSYFPGVFHTGIDISASMGTPIMSATNGYVYRAAWCGGYGNCVMVINGSQLVVYGHMSGFACATGQGVSQGRVIGYVGSTGWSTGPHLHFEIRNNFTTPVDPLNYLP